MPADVPFALALLGTGLALGLRHAFDADHVAAVSALASRTRSVRHSLLAGVVWGTGHTFTLLLAGLGVLAFKQTIPDHVAGYFELGVGVMLVGLGLSAFAAARRTPEATPGPKRAGLRGCLLRSFAVGAVHGLAGSAALMLLVLSSVSSVALGVAYIVVFGVGSVLGMLVFSGLLVVPLLLALRHEALRRGVVALAGAASLGVGALVVWEHLPL